MGKEKGDDEGIARVLRRFPNGRPLFMLVSDLDHTMVRIRSPECRATSGERESARAHTTLRSTHRSTPPAPSTHPA